MARSNTAPLRRVLGASAGIGGLLMVVGSFLPWIGTSTETGGRTAISGWGAITGDSDIAGTNLNDVLQLGGSGTYRPGTIGVIFGGVAIVAGVVMLAIAKGPRPHRVTAVLLVVCGLAGAVWGVIRGISPGDAGVFAAGEAVAGAGPWLTAGGGVVCVAVAMAVLLGAIAAPEPVRSRGIQPR